MFNCQILSPDKTVTYEGLEAVSLPGARGFFQIMSNHAETFQLLKKGTVIIDWPDIRKEKLPIEGGSCYFYDNQLSIIL